MSQRMRRQTGSLISISFFFVGVAGLVMMIFAGYALVKNRNSMNWPTTDGRVISSRTLLVPAGDPKGNGKVTRAHVVFSYAVDGKQYESDRISFEGNIGADINYYAPSYAAKYPERKEITVIYNPTNPAEAIIDRTGKPIVLGIISAMMMFSFAGYQIWLRKG